MDVRKKYIFRPKRHVPASSIAEVVVAIALIAMCFGIAATIFVRSLSAASRVSEVCEQTKEQLRFFERLQEIDGMEEESLSILEKDSTLDPKYKDVVMYTMYGADSRMVWQQQLMVKK